MFLEKHKLKNRVYDDVETTDLFLDNLDNSQFAVHKSNCKTAIMLTKTVPHRYKLPLIAVTFSKLVPGLLSQPALPQTPEPAPTPRVANVTQEVNLLDIQDKNNNKFDESQCCRVYHSGGGRLPQTRNNHSDNR